MDTARQLWAIEAMRHSIVAAREMMQISFQPQMWGQIIADREAKLREMEIQMGNAPFMAGEVDARPTSPLATSSEGVNG
jgi:hypothetical protein